VTEIRINCYKLSYFHDQCFFVMVCASAAYWHLFRPAHKFCENQLEVCSLVVEKSTGHHSME